MNNTYLVNGQIENGFSQNTIDIQSNNFCGGDINSNQLNTDDNSTEMNMSIKVNGGYIKIEKNKIVLYNKNNKVLFKTDDFGDLNSILQFITNFKFNTINLMGDQSIENISHKWIDLDAKFVYIKVIWPNNSEIESRNIEIGIPPQIGLVGDMNPGSIDNPYDDTNKDNIIIINPDDYSKHNYIFIKDVLLLNSNIPYKGKLLINNETSVHDIKIYIIQGK